MAKTSSEIVSIINTGTYPDGLTPEKFFSYEQIQDRRFYPSVEVTVNPESYRRNKSKDELSYSFKVKIFIKRLGDMSDEMSDLESIESEIVSLLQNATLQDHRIILETMDWNRINKNDKVSYIESTLTVRVLQVKKASMTQDGLLVFTLSGSTLDDAPAGDYQYISVFDTEIEDGYNSSDEPVTRNTDDVPVHFSGIYGGTFITNVAISDTDIGSTGEKLNKIKLLDSNGEKKEVVFTYTDKDNIESFNGITHVSYIEVDRIKSMYRHDDIVVYRIIGKTIKPGTITIS